MQSEHAWIFVHWQRLQVGTGLVEGALSWWIVSVQASKPEILREHLLREVTLQHRRNEPDVLVVSDTAAVIDLSYDIAEGDPRHVGLRCEVHVHLLAGDCKVGVHPLVRDVPAYRPKLPPLEDDGVEEGEAKQQLLELKGLLDACLVQILGEICKLPIQVGPQTLWRLVCDLDATLEHGNRECQRRHACQPEPVVLVDLVRVLRLLDCFKPTHPACGQVAVLQTHPVACIPAKLDELLSLRALALAQRDKMQPI
mmetsp:Transcript_85225/g.241486  ORF Transcript_85225/g.241486 Transcript_85225/m.241486 type:complete len:254 (+) Transcript_85225:1097-1858(+)